MPLPAQRSPSSTYARNDTRALFGTIFVKLGSKTDLAVGGRYDHQALEASQVSRTTIGGTPSFYTAPAYNKNAFRRASP